jgi:hypothetical protein
MKIQDEIRFKKYLKELVNRYACSLTKVEKITYTEAMISDFLSENHTNKLVFAEQKGYAIGYIDHQDLNFSCLWNAHIPHTTLFHAKELPNLVQNAYKEYKRLKEI